MVMHTLLGSLLLKECAIFVVQQEARLCASMSTRPNGFGAAGRRQQLSCRHLLVQFILRRP